MKILCLGNEFIKEDSFAKVIGKELIKEGYNIINIKDSFELISYINDENSLVIIDVVDKLKEVREIEIKELSKNKIISAHDFDASFFLQLVFNSKKIKIIGIPMKGDIFKIKEEVISLLK